MGMNLGTIFTGIRTETTPQVKKSEQQGITPCPDHETLFSLFYVLDTDRFLVVGLDHNSIGYPVKDPQFGIGHSKPADDAVHYKDNDEW